MSCDTEWENSKPNTHFTLCLLHWDIRSRFWNKWEITSKIDAFHYAIESAVSSVGNRPYWYSNDSILQHINNNIVVFNTLVNYKKSKHLAFAITALEEGIETENVEPGSTIFVYKGGNRQENKEDATQYMIEHYPKDRVAEVHGVYAHRVLLLHL